MRYEAGVLYARVAAPPVDGAANHALIELVAATFGIPKSRVSFHTGETARDKVLRIDGLTQPALLKRLEECLSSAPPPGQNSKAVE